MTSTLYQRRYFFVLQWSNRQNEDSYGTPLPSDAEALRLAYRIIRELKQAGGYEDPNLKIIVKNADNQVIHIVPF